VYLVLRLLPAIVHSDYPVVPKMSIFSGHTAHRMTKVCYCTEAA
jgi:hypothetical protein